MTNKHILLTSSGLGLGLGIAILSLVTVAYATPNPDKDTKDLCHMLAEQNKLAFARTEFRDDNFYQMCLNNIEYTSPLRIETMRGE